jgi:hypothetical protein
MFPSSATSVTSAAEVSASDLGNLSDDISSITNSTGNSGGSDDNPPPNATPPPPPVTVTVTAPVFASAAVPLKLDCLILPNKHILRTNASVVSTLPSLTFSNSCSFAPLSSSSFPASTFSSAGVGGPSLLPFRPPPPPGPPPPQLTVPASAAFLRSYAGQSPPQLVIPSSPTLFVPPSSSPSLAGRRSFLMMSPIISSPSSAHLISRGGGYDDRGGGVDYEVQRILSLVSSQPEGRDDSKMTIEDFIESKPLDDCSYDDTMLRSFSPHNGNSEEGRERAEEGRRRKEKRERKREENIRETEDGEKEAEERRKKVKAEEEVAEVLLKSPVLSISSVLKIPENDEQLEQNEVDNSSFGSFSPLSEFRKEVRRILIDFHNRCFQSDITNMSFEPMIKEKRAIM